MLPAVRLCSVVCGLALSCFAQGFQIGGPVAGLVFDAPSKSLRQVLGMPGAAHLSPALVADVDWASVAPNGRTAVVIRQGEARLVSAADIAQTPPGGGLEGLHEPPQWSAWAQDSSVVVLYSANTRALQWVRLNTQPPTLDPPIALDSVEGEVTALVTDATSKVAVVAVAGAGVYRVTSEGAVLVLPMADASAIAMSPGGDLLWVADRSNGQVLEVASPASNPESRILLSDSERFADLSALALSSDNKRLYLANRSTRVLYWLDRSTSLLSEGLELDTPATLFSPLGRPSLLLLLGDRAKLGDPFYLLDEQSGPSLFFVPAGEGDQQ
jgi:ABC-type uncharacterized transport system permease subunit